MEQSESAVDLFRRRQQRGKSTILVFYRADRSFFCKKWLRRWLTIPAFERRLELCDVYLLFVSSQSQGKALSVAEQIAENIPLLEKRIFFFGDPEHLLVKYLADNQFSTPFITNPDSHRAHGWVFDYGMVQPALLSITARNQIMYEWTSKPSLRNVAGKLERPDPWAVWDRIEQHLDRIRIERNRAQRIAKAFDPSLTVNCREKITTSSKDPHCNYQSKLMDDESDYLNGSTSLSPRVPHRGHFSSFEDAQITERTTGPSNYVAEDPSLTDEDREDDSFSRSRQETGSFLLEGENLSGCLTDDGLAPKSTAVDTLTPDHIETVVSKEEPDISDEEMRAVAPQVLSASLSALASQVLADNSINPDEESQDPIAIFSGLSSAINQEKHAEGRLTDDFEDDSDRSDNDKADFDQKEENKTSSHVNQAEKNERQTEGISVDRVDSNSTDLRTVSTSTSSRSSNEIMTPSGSEDQILEPVLSEPMTTTEPFDSPPSIREIEESIGSDHSENTDILMFAKRSSVLTEDSARINTITTDGRSFPIGSSIPEECELSIEEESDMLRELRDPKRSVHLAEQNELEAKLKHTENTVKTVTNPRLTANSSIWSSVSVVEEKGPSTKTWRTQPDRVTPSIDQVFGTSVTKSTTPIAEQTSSRDQESSEETTTNVEETEEVKSEGESYGTTSSHIKESDEVGLVPVDASPYADATYDLRRNIDFGKSPRTRDEYEAYDEYIVCEYEVEEFVEEIESDGWSQSKVFIPTTADETSDVESARTEIPHPIGSSSLTSPSTPLSPKVTTNPTRVLSNNCNSEEAKSPRKQSKLFEPYNESSSPPLSPELQSIPFLPQREQHGAELGPVQKVLRKIRSPSHHSSQRARDDHDIRSNSVFRNDHGNAEGEGQEGKLIRKDSLLSAVRKLPTVPRAEKGMFKWGNSERITSATDEFCNTKDEGEMVRRKETFRGLLRLKYGKNRENNSYTRPRDMKRGYGRNAAMTPSPTGHGHRHSLRKSLLGKSSGSSKLKRNITNENGESRDEHLETKEIDINMNHHTNMSETLSVNGHELIPIRQFEDRNDEGDDDDEENGGGAVIRTLSKLTQTGVRIFESDKDDEMERKEREDETNVRTHIKDGMDHRWVKFLRRKRKDENDEIESDEDNEEGERVTGKSSFALMSGRILNRLKVMC